MKYLPFIVATIITLVCMLPDSLFIQFTMTNVTNRHQPAYIVIIAANGGWVQIFLILYFLQIFDATGIFGRAA